MNIGGDAVKAVQKTLRECACLTLVMVEGSNFPDKFQSYEEGFFAINDFHTLLYVLPVGTCPWGL